MRPLALAAMLAALAGCSMHYRDKTFSATEKPRHMAEGEEHVVNDRPGEVNSSPQEDALREDAATVDGAGPEGMAPRIRSGAVFPATAQPTGREPVLESAPSEAGRSSQPVPERSNHE